MKTILKDVSQAAEKMMVQAVMPPSADEMTSLSTPMPAPATQGEGDPSSQESSADPIDEIYQALERYRFSKTGICVNPVNE